MMINSVVKKLYSNHPCTLLHPVFPNDNIIQLALLIHMFHISGSNQPQTKKHSGKKFQKVAKAKLELATHWQLFIQHLDCIYNNLQSI